MTAYVQLATLTTLRNDTHFDAQFKPNFAWRELWSTPAYTAASVSYAAYTGDNAKGAIDSSYNVTWTGGNWSFGAASSVLITGTGGLGYGTGSGGTVTQATSKATAVTLNKNSGQVTMNAASLASGATVQFLLNNTSIAATDCVLLTFNEAVSALNYNVWGAVGTGYCRVQLRNISGGALAEAVVLNFVVVKGATA